MRALSLTIALYYMVVCTTERILPVVSSSASSASASGTTTSATTTSTTTSTTTTTPSTSSKKDIANTTEASTTGNASNATTPEPKITQTIIDDAIASAQEVIGDPAGASMEVSDYLDNDFQSVMEDIESNQQRAQNVALLTKRIAHHIHRLNQKQVESLIDRLTVVQHDELHRRQMYEQSLLKRPPDDVVESMEELEQYMDVEAMVADGEAYIEAFVRKYIDQEVATLLKTTTESYEELADSFQQEYNELLESAQSATAEATAAVATGVDSQSAAASTSSCVSPSRAAQEVQTALLAYSQDGIGLIDHLQQQGTQPLPTIVYEMTSPTFQPPVQNTLGNWQKFIPEDWENLLPSGWEDWSLEVPSFLTESIPLLRKFTKNTNSVNPPEAVFHPNTFPGSCWPLAGSQGYITIRLPYPISVSAITIDHAPASLLLNAGQLESAPKDIRVFGFGPCESNECEGLGFNRHDKFLLTETSYDIEGSATQTFEVGTKETEEDDYNEDPPEDEDDDEDEDVGSCSAVTMTCDGPGDASKSMDSVAAIRVEILSNHGRPDFTCLYRVRVHGEGP